MSIPSSYGSTHDYLVALMTFLRDHQWIYNFPNTDILVNKVFDNFSPIWIDYFHSLTNADLNVLATGVLNTSGPNDLHELINKINTLKPKHKERRFEEISMPHYYRLSAKKGHEISCLAPLVKQICDERDVRVIIDVGSGLGYLTHLLYTNYEFKMLGIEGCPNKSNIAVSNQRKHYASSVSDVHYVEHYITENSATFLREKLCELFENTQQRMAIVGLHACADLSVTVMDIFREIDRAKSLIIMPCCYHRLEVEEVVDGKEIFRNFPKSAMLKSVFQQYAAENFLRRPFLRNACQQTVVAWNDMTHETHDLHAKNVLMRAVVQKVAQEEHLNVTRKKRKTGKALKSATNFVEDYLANLHDLFAFEYIVPPSRGEINLRKISDAVKKKYDEFASNLLLIEVFTALQMVLQGVFENLILLDRVEYLREYGIGSEVVKISDDRISPRCLGLVANKE